MVPHRLLVAACALPASLAMAARLAPQPTFLINTSPSEPPGLYIRSAAGPAPGRLAAFRTPEPGRLYAAAHLREIGRGGILKTLVGGAGDRACVAAGTLTLNGRPLGRVLDRDRRGRPLPRWTGCRTLGPGEYLAFSGRIPNSYDSRYYGPVRDADLIGVFSPLWTRP